MDIISEKSENIPPSTTGPSQISGVSETAWSEVERQASKESDPKALALLELRQFIKDEISTLKQEGENFKQNLKDYQKSLKRVDSLLIGIVVVVSIAFITTLSLVFFDLIKDKDLYLQNNNLYQNYSGKNLELKDVINEQKIEISNLKSEMQRIYDKNPYLK